jgi:hypothetical protein
VLENFGPRDGWRNDGISLVVFDAESGLKQEVRFDNFLPKELQPITLAGEFII